MGELASVSSLPVNRNTVQLFGRIEGYRVYQQTWFHRVMLPAKDEFAYPTAIEVRSSRKLGEKGSELNVLARIRGMHRSFSYTDKKTGAVEQGDDYTTWFEVE